MERKEIKKAIYTKIDDLPTLPAVLPKILSLIEDKNSSVITISQVISNDPALAANILKVANSAYYGFSKEITRIDQAVGLLGLKMVKALTVSIGVLGIMPKSCHRPNFSQQGLWKHCLASATMMQTLTGIVGLGAEGDHLFIVGLLHDIGKIILAQVFGDQFQRALEDATAADEPIIHLTERKHIGVDHGEAGAMLLSRWQFPRNVINIIANHHRREALTGTEARDAAMLHLVDALSYDHGFGEVGNPKAAKIDREELARFKIGERIIESLKEKSGDLEESVNAFYNAIS